MTVLSVLIFTCEKSDTIASRFRPNGSPASQSERSFGRLFFVFS